MDTLLLKRKGGGGNQYTCNKQQTVLLTCIGQHVDNVLDVFVACSALKCLKKKEKRQHDYICHTHVRLCRLCEVHNKVSHVGCVYLIERGSGWSLEDAGQHRQVHLTHTLSATPEHISIIMSQMSTIIFKQ